MKYLLYGLAAALVLSVAVLVAAVLLIDPNQYKDQIAGTVEKHTGRTLQIQGDLELSVFPWIGVQTGPLELGNAPGFGPEPFLQVKAAEIRVKLLPLLTRRVEVKRVVLDGVVVNLARDRKGRTNWEDLAGKEKGEPKAPVQEGEQPALAALALEGITIWDGVITWKDRLKKQTIRLDQVNAYVGSLRFGDPTDVRLGFVLHLDRPALKETVALEAKLLLDEQMQRIEIQDLQLQSHSEGEIVPGGRLQADLSVKRLITDLAAETLGLERLRLEAAEAVVTGDLAAQSIQSNPTFSGSWRLQAPLRDTLAAFDLLPPTSDAGALSRLELSFKLTGDANRLNLSEFQGTLDDTHWNGGITVANLADPAIGFDLRIDGIDVDRYLPPETSSSSSSSTPPKAEKNDQPLPLASLAARKLDGKLQIEELKLKNLHLRDLSLKVQGKNRVLTLEPSVGDLYQGRFLGTVRIDGRGRIPALAIRSQLRQVAVDKLLQDYLQKPAPISGTAVLDLNLQGRGNTETALKRSLNGKIAFHVKDGSLNNVEIVNLIRQGELWWKGKASLAENLDRLRFVALDFLASVRNGVVETERFLIDSRKFKIEGSGNIDLARSRLDYTLQAIRLKHEETPSGEKVAAIKGLPIIVKITGPLEKPKYFLDVAAMAKAKFHKKIEKKKAKIERKIQEKLEKKLGPGAGQLLKGLFGQ